MSERDTDAPQPERPAGASSPPRLRTLDSFDLHDLESVRLILAGSSVIDWHRLNFTSADQARRFLRIHELDPTRPKDQAFIEHLIKESTGYLRRHFAFAIPKPVEQASLEELLLLASSKGHRQLCACTVLKTLHIIHHMAGRELLFRLPVSDKDMFHLVEEKVYRVVGAMLSGGFPITEFIGGRKNLDSTYTKLLSKTEATAAKLYDKLRFRIVTRTQEDILPVILYLTENLFPFNYVVPHESTNTILHLRRYCQADDHLKALYEDVQGQDDDPSSKRNSSIPPLTEDAAEETFSAGDNRFSAPSYRVIHFVTDVPVRVPRHIMELAPPGSETLGPVVFMLCEFQILDRESDAQNESGEASHEAYKARQRAEVMHRLRLAGNSPKGAPRKDD